MDPHLVHPVEGERVTAPDDGGVNVHDADVPDDDLLRLPDLEALAADHALAIHAHDGLVGAHIQWRGAGRVVGHL